MNVCSNCIYKKCCGSVRTSCDGRQTINQAKANLNKALFKGDLKLAKTYQQLIDRYNK